MKGIYRPRHLIAQQLDNVLCFELPEINFLATGEGIYFFRTLTVQQYRTCHVANRGCS